MTADRLTVNLSAADWNLVLGCLGKAPFETVASVILDIRDQCVAQQRPSSSTSPPTSAEDTPA